MITQYITFGKQMIVKKDFPEAKKYFQKVLELDPGNPDVKKCIDEYFPINKKD